MKSINIDVNALVNALNTGEGLNKPVGHGKDVHGTFFVAFVATDKETKLPIMTQDGKRYKLNFRTSKRQEG